MSNPWSNQLVSLVIVTAPPGQYAGIFVYSPTPGHGNLIGSWAAQAGTDPYGNTYPQGLNVTVGSISGVTFNGTNFVLNSSGMFFYAGTPALDNLIVSISNITGNDAFGNSFLPGIVSYGGVTGKWSAMSIQQGGLINWYFQSNTDMNGAWGTIQGQIVPGGTANLVPTLLTTKGQGFLVSDQLAVNDAINNIALSPIVIGGRGFYVLGNVGTLTIPFLVGADPNLGGANPETWHDMRPLANSFIGTNAGFYPPQYRRTVEGYVEIRGNVKTPPTTGNYNSTTFATLPANYRPQSNDGARWPAKNVADGAASPIVHIDTSGNLSFNFLPTSLAQTTIEISGRFALDQTGLILT